MPAERLTYALLPTKDHWEALRYFIEGKNLGADERYTLLLMRLLDGSKTLETPLTASIFHYPLIDSNVDTMFGDEGE